MIRLLLLLSPAFAGPPTDFRGIKLGSECSTVEGLQTLLIEREGTPAAVHHFTREGEDLTLGSVQLQKVMYDCWDGKLLAVHVDLATRADAERLLPGLTKVWGEPRHPEYTAWVWIADGLADGTMTMLTNNPRDPYLRISDIELTVAAAEAIAAYDASKLMDGL